MKYLFNIIIILSLNGNCQSKDIAFNETDIYKIQELKNQFDLVLKKYYTDYKMEEAYKAYLSDLSKRKVNPTIIDEKESIRLLFDLKKSSSFSKVWRTVLEEEAKSYRIDYNEVFYKYVVDQSKDNKELNELIKSIKTPEKFNVDPFLIVEMLSSYLKDEHYKHNCTKLVISIIFYYDIVLQFKKDSY